VQLFVGRSKTNSKSNRQFAFEADSEIQWTLHSEANPGDKLFRFQAEEDGIYYFTTRTIDTTGQAHTTGNRLVVRVQTVTSTTEAAIEIVIDADADDQGIVQGRYQVQATEAIRDLRVLYMTNFDKVWVPLDVTATKSLSDTGQARGSQNSGIIRFQPPGNWDQISIVAVVVDMDGVEHHAQRTVHRPRIAEKRVSPIRMPLVAETANLRSDLPTSSDSITSQTVQFSPKSNSEKGVHPARPSTTGEVNRPSGRDDRITVTAVPRTGANVATAIGSGTSPETIPLPPPATPTEISNAFGLNAPSQVPTPVTKPAQESITPWNPVVSEASGNPFVSRPKTVAEALRPLAQNPYTSSKQQPSEEAGMLPSTGVPAESLVGQETSSKFEEIPRAAEYSKDLFPKRSSARVPIQTQIDPRTPVRHTDSARFSLDYELESIDAMGVDAVELWGSLDGGRSWKRWGADPDRQSPFDIETNGDGVYSYRIVVVSKNGLASPRPLDGDLPDIVVIVDSKQPEVRITGAKYGEGSYTGSLVINFSCEDDNLPERPIALAFSESLEGPWTTIASGLRNDGMYAWPGDPQLPRQFYLRMDATDSAGNVASYTLDLPIDAQGLAPRARIRGVQSLGGGNSSITSDEQTATRQTDTDRK
jgi:hypothetical protein